MEASTTLSITYGVCVDGVSADGPRSEFTDPQEAIDLANEIKRADPDILVTICLWT